MQIKSEKKSSILDLLVELAPDSSKNTLRSWIEKGRVTANGKEVKHAKHMVDAGELIEVGTKPKFLFQGLKIIYEDEDLVVVDKPAGLLSVATDIESEISAHRILKRRYHNRKVFPIHRLDKETSGLLVFAYNEIAKEDLKHQLAKRDLTREYRAVVEGHPGKGTWRNFLRENNQMQVFVCAPSKGKEAITHYETLKKTKNRSLLKLRLQTGRKHQIRVQAAHAGCPIVGDAKYGKAGKQLCLQAVKLVFAHPKTKKEMAFSVPSLWK